MKAEYTVGRPEDEAVHDQAKDASTRHIRNRYRFLAGLFTLVEPQQQLSRLNLTRMAVSGDVLEVGVGTGAGLPFYDQARSVTAIDLSPAMLEKARRHLSRCQRPVRLVEMDVQSLTFPENTFDAVVCSYVFCTVPDPLLGLSEIRRVLKPGGAAVFLEHVRGEGWLGPVTDAIAPLFRWAAGCNPNRDTVGNIRAAGFKLVSVETLKPSIVKYVLASPNKPRPQTTGRISEFPSTLRSASAVH